MKILNSMKSILRFLYKTEAEHMYELYHAKSISRRMHVKPEGVCFFGERNWEIEKLFKDFSGIV